MISVTLLHYSPSNSLCPHKLSLRTKSLYRAGGPRFRNGRAAGVAKAGVVGVAEAGWGLLTEEVYPPP